MQANFIHPVRVPNYTQRISSQRMENNIRKLRLERGLTLEQLAEAVDTNAAQIQKLEVGDRRLTHQWMIRICKPLHCSPEQLISDGAHSMLPVLGKLKSGLIIMNKAADPLDEKQWIKTPSWVEYSEDLYILAVEDDTMAPKVYQGDFVIVRKNNDAMCGDLNSRTPHLVTIKNGDTMLRLVRKGYTFGKYNLLGHNTDMIEDVILDRCDRVIGTILG